MIKYWLLATRPKTLSAGVCPVVLGTVLAFYWDVVHWLAAIVALLASLMIQIGTNFANDYFDYVKGADTDDRLGPARMTQQGHISPSAMKTAFKLCFGLAFLFGLYLVVLGGWPILAIGLSAILFGVLYTGGPYPLAYLGLGDIFAFVFFGPVAVAGTYYVQTLTWHPGAVLLGCGVGAFSVALLTVNNLRDIDSDRQAGKRTLAVRFGAGFARLSYGVSIGVALVVPVILMIVFSMPMGVLLPMFTVAVALGPIQAVYSQTGRELNLVLAKTGQMIVIYTILFTLGILLPLISL